MQRLVVMVLQPFNGSHDALVSVTIASNAAQPLACATEQQPNAYLPLDKVRHQAGLKRPFDQRGESGERLEHFTRRRTRCEAPCLRSHFLLWWFQGLDHFIEHGKIELQYDGQIRGFLTSRGNASQCGYIDRSDEERALPELAGLLTDDTSPFYGFGLSEYRLGRFLRGKDPDHYVVSTKVGRVLTAAVGPRADHAIWKSPAPFTYRYDYTAAGTRRSVEGSLQRLGLPRIDIVFIHDISPDNTELEGGWEAAYRIARTGAMVELEKMRDEGLIKAWGFGVNTPNAVVQALASDDPTPDIVLLACQYSLLDHSDALRNTFPALSSKGTSVVVGTPLNDGFLGGRSRYNFSLDLPAGAVETRARIMAVASRHGIDIHTAALQFAAAHPQVSAIIPGARSPGQIVSNVQAMKVGIPAAFWEELKSQSLIDAQAPVPS